MVALPQCLHACWMQGGQQFLPSFLCKRLRCRWPLAYCPSTCLIQIERYPRSVRSGMRPAGQERCLLQPSPALQRAHAHTSQHSFAFERDKALAHSLVQHCRGKQEIQAATPTGAHRPASSLVKIRNSARMLRMLCTISQASLHEAPPATSTSIRGAESSRRIQHCILRCRAPLPAGSRVPTLPPLGQGWQAFACAASPLLCTRPHIHNHACKPQETPHVHPFKPFLTIHKLL